MAIINDVFLNDYGVTLNKSTKSVTINGKDVSKYTQYVKTVGEKGDFLYLKDAMDWFNASGTSNYEFILDSTSHLVTDTITVNNSSHCCIIRGLGSCQTLLIAGTGLANKPMFNIQTHCDFDKIGFVGTSLTNYGTQSTENCMNFTTLNAIYVEIQNCVFSGFYNHINDTIGSSLFVFNSILKDSTSSSIKINTTGSNQFLDCEVCTFENCLIGVDLLKANTGSFYISEILFIQRAGDTSIKYTGGTGNYVYTGVCTITATSYNFLGTFLSGFLFNGTETPVGRDANIMIINNQGVENKTPHAKINCLNSSVTTTVTTAGTFYKTAFTNTSSYTCKFTIGNNRFTYQPTVSRDLKMWISCNVLVNQNSRNVDIAIIKNGNPALGLFGQMTCRAVSQNVAYPVSTCVYIDGPVAGDYYELWVTSSSNSDVVTVQDVAILCDCM